MAPEFAQREFDKFVRSENGKWHRRICPWGCVSDPADETANELPRSARICEHCLDGRV
jgi:hypothetical protein